MGGTFLAWCSMTTGDHSTTAGCLNSFRGCIHRAGLPRFSPYALRHTYASHLLGAGVPITYVQHQLGHSKPVTTLAFYAHFLPDESRKYADQLEVIRAAVRCPQGSPPETSLRR